MISTDNSNVGCVVAFGHVLDWYEEHCVCARGHNAVSTTPTAQAANLIGTGFNPVMAITAFDEPVSGLMALLCGAAWCTSESICMAVLAVVCAPCWSFLTFALVPCVCVDAVGCMFLSLLALHACLCLCCPLTPALFSYVAGSSAWTWCGGTVFSVTSDSLNSTLELVPDYLHLFSCYWTVWW
jgi:hypothetical protein